MRNWDLFMIWIIMGGWAVFSATINDVKQDDIIAAISDSGCASHQPPAPGYKQRIETYNLSSLKGNN
jgi:hypothetical protein